MKRLKNKSNQFKILLHCLLKGRFNQGVCPVCERKTYFIKKGDWLRDEYICILCNSIPRHRAIIRVIEMMFPDYRNMRLFESSPCGAASDKLKKNCSHYLSGFYYEDIPPGEFKSGHRCENLERLTFDDNTFDLVVTQDVLEHVLNPELAFKEISRVLRPDGAHVFTVPYYYWQKTFIRARKTHHGMEYLAPKIYHGNPIDENGSLVVTEWGEELAEYIYEHSGMATTAYNLRSCNMGLEAEFLEVFVSRKGLSQQE